jgi:hypothetical protein
VTVDRTPRTPSVPLGLSVAGSEIVGFASVGLLIDYATGALFQFPWCTVVFAPLGVVVALWHLTRLVRPAAKP